MKDLKRTRQPVFLTLGRKTTLSPSAIGTARVDGEPLAGRQTVDVLNGVGLDWATFGNHEFNVSLRPRSTPTGQEERAPRHRTEAM